MRVLLLSSAIPWNQFLPMSACQAHSPEVAKDGPESREYAELAVAWYKHLFRFRSQVSPKNYFCIDYRDLRKDPVGIAEKLYGHFGWAMSEGFRAKLGTIGARNKNYHSSHQYTLEEFGLSCRMLEKELAPILKAYGLV
jgi:hypothetical protein